MLVVPWIVTVSSSSDCDLYNIIGRFSESDSYIQFVHLFANNKLLIASVLFRSLPLVFAKSC